jgi:hypothetical protein
MLLCPERPRVAEALAEAQAEGFNILTDRLSKTGSFASHYYYI